MVSGVDWGSLRVMSTLSAPTSSMSSDDIVGIGAYDGGGGSSCSESRGSVRYFL